LPPLLLDRATDLAQMLTKRETSLISPAAKVILEFQLRRQAFATRDFFRLPDLGRCYGGGGFEDLLNSLPRHKDTSIIISEHKIISRYLKVPKRGDLKRIRALPVEALRSGGTGSVTENRKADFLQLG